MAEPKAQLDLFYSFVGETVPLRDERESMSMPLCSLSKRKRIKPIEWTSSDRKRWVKVTAPAESGIATIWDLDIVLWAISQLNEAVERDAAVGHSIRFQAYDLLKATGRHTGGKNYAELEMALRRLTGTVIETSIRADKRRGKAMFHWVEAWSHDLDQDGRSKGMTITVPDWIYQAVVVDRSVLAISPKYFEITSGIGRWLYRLARRHAGKQPNGWRFTMKDLHKRSGSTQVYGQFARDLRRIIDRGNFPGYAIETITGQRGDEVVVMTPTAEMPQDKRLRRIDL